MLRKIIAWTIGVALAVPLLLVLALAVVGVPKPPQVTAENVGRVSIRPPLENMGMLRHAMRSVFLEGWLPDGERMLVRASHRFVDFRLQVVDAPGARPRLLASLPRQALVYSRPGLPYIIAAWDSDGDERTQLHRWDLGERRPVLLTSGSERAWFGAFEPAGSRIAYATTRRNGIDIDLHVMDPHHPESDQTVLTEGGIWRVDDWSPAGDILLVSRIYSNILDQLYLLHLEERTPIELTDTLDGGSAYVAPRFTRDGMGILYASDRGTEFRHLRRLDLATRQETILSAEIPWDIVSHEQSGDGGFLLLGVNEDGRNRYYIFDLENGTTRLLDLFESGTVLAALHPIRPLVRINHTDLAGLVRGYVYDLNTRELTFWAGGAPLEMDLPAPRLVRYPTFDSVAGEPRRISAFLYPGRGNGPRPVLIDIHGGPAAQAREGNHHFPMQNVGISVITPNVRGSTGYGRSFAKLDDGFLREDAVRDIGALLDWIHEQPDLDASRVMVTGGSYGGYMVLASLVHFGERIRCGISRVGISNFVTMLEGTEYIKEAYRAEFGDERDPEVRAFLESIAPVGQADRIRSALMVIHGAQDPRVPVGEARQIVERVRSHGLPITYIEAANEGHDFTNPWNSIYAGLAEYAKIQRCLLR